MDTLVVFVTDITLFQTLHLFPLPTLHSASWWDIFPLKVLTGKILFWKGLHFTDQQWTELITAHKAGKFCTVTNVTGEQMNLPMHTHDLCTVNTNSYTRISWCKNSTRWCGTTYASQSDNAFCRLFAVASLWTVTHRLNLSPLPFPPAPSHLLSCGLTN